MKQQPTMRVLTGLVLAVSLGLPSCGASAPIDAGVSVVATTTILGDLARNVVGAHGTVTVLLPIGADPHDYQTSARQAASLYRADIVVANGLGLEEGLADVLNAATEDGANILELAPLLNPLSLADDHHESGLDPHVWLDPVRMADAARLLADELESIEPDIDWAIQAERYAAALMATDDEIRDILSSIPPENRELVTSHESLHYFAARYDFGVVGVVIPGGATLANPSSAELAALVREIERLDVPALFAEISGGDPLTEAVAAEVDNVEVVELFVGSLAAPGSEAGTLIGMLLSNARRIADALS